MLEVFSLLPDWLIIAIFAMIFFVGVLGGYSFSRQKQIPVPLGLAAINLIKELVIALSDFRLSVQEVKILVSASRDLIEEIKVAVEASGLKVSSDIVVEKVEQTIKDEVNLK